VAKEARGKGVSKKLMKALLDEFEKIANITKVKLSVNKQQIPAVKLYEGFGFKVVGQENLRLGDGNYYDELLMEKIIERVKKNVILSFINKITP
jgi:ribosomal protein S18 acetylase RimI-like enzyme